MSLKSLQPRLPRDEEKKRSRDLMINLLLLGIIAEHPVKGKPIKDPTRLARAREALFGDNNTKGQKSTLNPVPLYPLIDEAFKTEMDGMRRLTMSRQSPEVREKFKAKIAESEPTFRGLANKYSSYFKKNMTETSSTEDWLRRALNNISITGHDLAELEGLYYGNSPEAERLQRVFDDLNSLGIACKSPVGTKKDDITPK